MTLSLPAVPGVSMQREQFAQVRALFDAVCDLDEPLRRARLHELSDDAAVIAKVQALLDRTEMNPWQIVEPALKSLAASGGEVQVGDRLGNWTLLAQIGHGGMGTVYRAQRNDGHFEQIAAIKLLRGIPSSEALERLAQERQILARLSHPNIARLLDGGATPSGQPYIVMDYVEGVSIDDYLRQRSLALPELLRLLIAVADGVSFAHQRLIVHCDLKPGNILVDAHGRPVLLDFGIASLIDDRGLPAPGSDDRSTSRAFTPGYASPEQRAGSEVSTATDVYGLGRVLWHLLQSDRNRVAPRPTTDSWDALAVDDPGNAAVPRALRAIVKRATASDPAQRYISVSAFADDLRRFLERQPVAAMGAQRGYLLACYLRRNALVLSLVAVAALALLGGLLGTWLSLRDARLQRQQAQAAGARAERTAEFLGNLLSAADPDQARNLDTRLVRLLLDDAARNAQKELADEPLVLAQISAVISKTYHQISEYALAQQYLQQALDLLPPERVRERLAVRQKIALALGAQGQTPLALQQYETIFREREQAFGADDPDTLESAHALAFQWTDNGDFPHALQASSALQPRLERLLGSDHEITLANLQTLAIARTELGQFDAAEETLQSLLQRRLRVNGELNSQTIAVQTSLAILYLRQQRFAQAEALLRELLPKAEQRFGNLSFAAINFASLLGSALRLGGKLDESRPYYRAALDRATQAWGADNTRTLNYELNYANLEVASGQADPALQRLARIEPALTTSLGAENPSLAELERTRARALAALGRNTAARQAWQRALAIDRKVFGDDTHPQVVEDLTGIAALKDG